MGGAVTEPDGLDKLDGLDETILDQLAELLDRVDGPPDGFSEQMRFAVAARGLRDELARQVESVSLTARAGDTPGTTWTFEAPSLTVMVVATPSTRDRNLVDGWLAPTGVRTVRLRLIDGTILEVTADEAGRFRFSAVPRGLAQLVVLASDARPGLVTPTFEL